MDIWSYVAVVFSLTLCFQDVAASYYCHTDIFKWEYCDWGCCDGNSAYSICCELKNTGMVVGTMVSALILVAVIVSIFICCVCCSRRSAAARGHVFGNAATTQSATVTASNMTFGQHQSYPMQPTNMSHGWTPLPQDSGAYPGSKMGNDPPHYPMQTRNMSSAPPYAPPPYLIY